MIMAWRRSWPQGARGCPTTRAMLSSLNRPYLTSTVSTPNVPRPTTRTRGLLPRGTRPRTPPPAPCRPTPPAPQRRRRLLLLHLGSPWCPLSARDRRPSIHPPPPRCRLPRESPRPPVRRRYDPEPRRPHFSPLRCPSRCSASGCRPPVPVRISTRRPDLRTGRRGRLPARRRRRRWIMSPGHRRRLPWSRLLLRCLILRAGGCCFHPCPRHRTPPAMSSSPPPPPPPQQQHSPLLPTPVLHPFLLSSRWWTAPGPRRSWPASQISPELHCRWTSLKYQDL